MPSDSPLPHEANKALIRCYTLEYKQAAGNGVSLLSSVRITGGDSTGPIAALPPIKFEYTEFSTTDNRYETVIKPEHAPPGGLVKAFDLVDLHKSPYRALLHWNSTIGDSGQTSDLLI